MTYLPKGKSENEKNYFTVANLFAQETKHNGKLAVALLAGIALGGIISSLFSTKKFMKIRREDTNSGRMISLKDSYTEMSNRLAN
ncbi:hypothetical protein [Pedobacter sp. JCM 36344]|uniref:hypothetical protein n=1 Tax=Pedobacter sp. JCM 36344 TaxID=3374280 RepID=UPI0039782644